MEKDSILNRRSTDSPPLDKSSRPDWLQDTPLPKDVQAGLDGLQEEFTSVADTVARMQRIRDACRSYLLGSTVETPPEPDQGHHPDTSV